MEPAVRAIINPKRGLEASRQATPAPSQPCGGGEGDDGKSCLSLDIRLAVLLVTLAGVVVLLLLYRLLQLRHRLKMARARHALEYYGFYHSATYRLRHMPLYDDDAKTVTKNGHVCDTGSAPLQTVTSVTPPAITVTSLPLLPRPPSISPAPLEQATPFLLPTPPVQAMPLFIPPAPVQATPSFLPLPVAQATPPSPHLSWGACSDAELYSRIGAHRSSRLSSLSSQSRVILFEHSAL